MCQVEGAQAQLDSGGSCVLVQSGEDGLLADEDDMAVWGSSTAHSHR